MSRRSNKLWGALFLSLPVTAIWAGHFDASTAPILLSVSVFVIAAVKFSALLEAIGATLIRCDRTRRMRRVTDGRQRATAVILAYLPNEQAIIVPAVRHFLTSFDRASLERVIVAYNSPRSLPVEDELEKLADSNRRVEVLRVSGSASKAENLNAALQIVGTPIVGFFDADSRPRADCFDRARVWLRRGFAFVQGSNNVRDQKGFLARLVHIESWLKNHVSYTSRFSSLGITYFTGSNGYWRTEVARALGAEATAQVEDIDMSIRALLAGQRLAFDPAIAASEEPPPSWHAWWHQRLRWGQGWTQLLKWHQMNIVRSRLDPKTKFVWTFFLLGRRLIAPTAYLIGPIAYLFQFAAGIPINTAELVGFFLIVGVQLTATALSIITVSQSRRHVCFGARPFSIVLYIALFPLYDILRDVTILLGTRALFVDPGQWRVTPRQA